MVDDEIDEDFNTINTLQLFEEVSSNTLKIKLRTSKDDYFKKLNNMTFILLFKKFIILF